MLPLDDEDDSRTFSLISWLQVLVVAAVITGSAWVLGGARTWVQIPVWIGIGVLIALQIVRTLFSGNSSLQRWDGVDFFAAAFLVYAFFRYWTGPIEYFARQEWLMILSCASVFWTARYALYRSVQAIFLLQVLVCNGVALSVFAGWLHFHPEVLLYGQNLANYYAPRFLGPFGCPNHLGDFLLICTAAAAGLALYTRGHGFYRAVIGLAALLMIVVIGLTLSRGSWMGLILLGLALTIFSLRHASLRWPVPMIVYGVGIALALVAVAQVPSLAQRLDEVWGHLSRHTLDQYVRVQLDHDAWRIWQDHFWLGAGPSTFGFLHPRYQGPNFTTHAYYAHNDYLNTLCDYGFVGGFLVLCFAVGVTLLLLRQVDHRAPSSSRILLASAGGAWLGVLTHCLVDFNLHIPACALALFLITGLGLRRSSSSRWHLPMDQRRSWTFCSAVALAVALAWLTILTWRVARGFYPYWEATGYSTDLQPNSSESVLSFQQVAPLLQKAVQADPRNSLALTLFGDLYRLQGTQSTSAVERESSFSESIRWYREAARQNPLDDDLLWKASFDLECVGRIQEAFWCETTICQRQPFNGFYHQALGRNLLRRGRLREATEAFQAAAECPYGQEGAEDELRRIQGNLPAPYDPYHHEPTLP